MNGTMGSVQSASAVRGFKGLTISDIQVTAIRAPLAREFRGSYYRMTHRVTLLTRIHTTEGIVGEAYVGDEDAGLLEIAGIVTKEIRPKLLGEDAFGVERCWQLAYPATFDILRDRRLGLVALAGVDSAIWDAIGKALNVPLWRLWGGFRREIPLVAIGGYYGEPLGPIADEIAFYKEAGLAGMKFKIGGARPEVDVERVAAAREAAGDDFIITVMRTRDIRCRTRWNSPGGRKGSISAGSRSRCAGTTIGAPCATCASAAASPCARGRANSARADAGI